jgi:hypothetical protein
MKTIDVVIMTKSAMNGGNCVAAINIEDGKWVRLVNVGSAPLTFEDLLYYDNTEVDVLEVARVPIIDIVPEKRQPENVLIQKGAKWEFLKKYSIDDVFSIHPNETPSRVFENTERYVPITYMPTASLILINVDNLRVYKEHHDNDTSLRADFYYNEEIYKRFPLTDWNYYNINDEVKMNHAYIVVSIALKPYEMDGKHYKIIAKIFPEPSLRTSS